MALVLLSLPAEVAVTMVGVGRWQEVQISGFETSDSDAGGKTGSYVSLI
jgi:hypothetical protein